MRPGLQPSPTKSRLVIAPQWVGDAVMASPMIASLSEAGPVDVACLPGLTDLFAAMPAVRQVMPLAFERGQLQWGLRRALGRSLQGRHYSQAIVCPNSWKAALLPWFAQIPQRTGLLGEWRFGLVNDRREARPSADGQQASQPAQYDALADQPDQAQAQRKSHRPLLVATGHEVPSPQRPRLALCPGAAYGPAKQWPTASFAALAAQWIGHGGEVVLLGGPGDRPVSGAIAQAIAAEQPTGPSAQAALVVEKTGQTSLGQAMAWLASSQVVVSNDSGLMHLAAALGRPCIGLYGSSSEQQTPAFGPHWLAVSLDLPCRPCFDRTCRLGTTACLRDLEVGQVVSLLQSRGWWPDRLDC